MEESFIDTKEKIITLYTRFPSSISCSSLPFSLWSAPGVLDLALS